MSEMIEVKTSDLTGAALDWAVAEADGLRPYPYKGAFWVLDGVTNTPLPRFSTDWAQGGPLRDQYRIDIIETSGLAVIAKSHKIRPVVGDSALQAVCRAIVQMKMGDSVSVPVELVGEVV